MKRAVVAVLSLAAVLLCVALGHQSHAQAFPEPALVTREWKLDFRYETPRPIAVRDVDGTLQWYWYMIYTVTNNSGRDRLLIPEIVVATDTGKVITAGRNVPPAVFNAIRERHRNPLLESPAQMVGNILQGRDFAKTSVAIWPNYSENVNRFSIFVAGLSGETASIAHPLTGDRILMRRTIMLDFSAPGDPATPQDQPIVFEGRRDVMR